MANSGRRTLSPRARIAAVVAVVSALAVATVVGVTLLQTRGERTREAAAKPRKGAPPLVLDFGLRDDAEARALSAAAGLYTRGRRGQAGRIFAQYDSLPAQVGQAFSRWPDHSLDRVRALAVARPSSGLVLLHLGLAQLWTGRAAEAVSTWRRAEARDPDTPYAVQAESFLHAGLPRGRPLFQPSAPPPAGLAGLPAGRQVALLARRARGRDVEAKLLYGVALQGLGRFVSAEAQFVAAARLAPRDPDAEVAAAFGRFTKDRPVAAFSRLGPLTRRFPRAPTVRFHLGLLLIWSGDLRAARRQLRLARSEGPRTMIGREANRYLDALVSGGTS